MIRRSKHRGALLTDPGSPIDSPARSPWAAGHPAGTVPTEKPRRFLPPFATKPELTTLQEAPGSPEDRLAGHRRSAPPCRRTARRASRPTECPNPSILVAICPITLKTALD